MKKHQLTITDKDLYEFHAPDGSVIHVMWDEYFEGFRIRRETSKDGYLTKQVAALPQSCNVLVVKT